MKRPEFAHHRQHLFQIQNAALQAADPLAAVTAHLRLSPGLLHAGSHALPLKPETRIYLIALGKASPAMTEAAAGQLGPKLSAGVAAVPLRHEGELPQSVRTFTAGHPLPDEGSLAAGSAAAALLRSTRKDDLVIVLISGGGSAMFERPLPGITLDDLQRLFDLLLRSGAPIEDFNTVRRAVSSLKAGGLARLAAPARCVALILSDVVGDRLSMIASGPTALRRAPPRAARAVLERFGLWEAAPDPIRKALLQPRPAPPRAPRPIHVIVGSNRLVVEAACRQCEALGFPTRILSKRMHGEARRVGRNLATRLVRAPRPSALLMGGETTVTVQGAGKGGRNQETALAAAMVLDGIRHVAVMTLATDGMDGPTDAAGAVVSGETLGHMRRLNIDPHAALAENDAYPVLHACRALIRTGPTGTNLNDLVVGLAY
jgi:glycerate 2-kinase